MARTCEYIYRKFSV